MDTDAAMISSANYRKKLNQVSKNLVSKDINQLKYLYTDIIPRARLDKMKRGNEIFSALEDQGKVNCLNTYLIAEGIFRINRFDILNHWQEWSRDSVIAEAENVGSNFSPFRLLLHYISGQLSKQDVEDMKYAVMDYVTVPRNKLDDCSDPLTFFILLEQLGAVTRDNLEILKDLFETIDRNDLIQHIQTYYQSIRESSLPGGGGNPGDQGGFTVPSTSPTAPSLTQSSTSLWNEQTSTMSLNRRVITTPEERGSDDTLHSGQYMDRPVLREWPSSGPDPGILTRSHETQFTQHQNITQRVHQPQDNDNDRSPVMTTMQPISDEDPEDVRQQMIQKLNQLTASDMPCYPMSKTPRGIAVIISNYKFHVVETNPQSRFYPKREGTQIDQKILSDVFEELGFKVDQHPDKTAEEILQLLNMYSQTDHTEYDAFVVCILTHGLLGKVTGCDGVLIEICDITRKFKALDCPSLRGKPKLFIIQACQGKAWQEGAQIETDCENLDTDHVPHETIPNESDFLLGYATVPGFVSYRSKTLGSWYITTLVDTIKKYHVNYDLLTILTKVTEEMGKKIAKEKFKQCPLPWSTLRMRLFFSSDP